MNEFSNASNPNRMNSFRGNLQIVPRGTISQCCPPEPSWFTRRTRLLLCWGRDAPCLRPESHGVPARLPGVRAKQLLAGRMSKIAESIVVVLFFTGVYIALPAAMIWGWVRWARRTQAQTRSSILSLIGFGLATASALLAISSLLYSHAIGGFPFYDPLLLRIYRWGGLLSLTGIIFGICGAWQPSSLRWHAPGCAIGMFVFWSAMAMGE